MRHLALPAWYSTIATLATAVDDQNVAAVISQCLFTDDIASSLALDPLSSLKVTALALHDQLNFLLRNVPVV